MCEITVSLKKRFCTDMGLSIQLFAEPYFMDRIKLYKKENEWNKFVEMLKKYNTDEDFFAEYNKLKDNAINYIKDSEAFNSLNTEASSFFEIPQDINIPDRDAYKEINIGRKFLSLDMIKANFTSLVYYGKKTNKRFFEEYNYSNFLRQFTDNEYFINSKYIRQVIFGNCNCKRMISYEKIMMVTLLNKLLHDFYILSINIGKEQVYSLRADEIIFDITDVSQEDIDKIKNLLSEAERLSGLDFPIDLKVFVIRKFKNEDVYIKQYENGSFDLKKVDSEDSPAVYRYMNNQPPNDLDLYFFHNGRLAKFEEHKTWELE